jgi:hypothetical protein
LKLKKEAEEKALADAFSISFPVVFFSVISHFSSSIKTPKIKIKKKQESDREV